MKNEAEKLTIRKLVEKIEDSYRIKKLMNQSRMRLAYKVVELEKRLKFEGLNFELDRQMALDSLTDCKIVKHICRDSFYTTLAILALRTYYNFSYKRIGELLNMNVSGKKVRLICKKDLWEAFFVINRKYDLNPFILEQESKLW